MNIWICANIEIGHDNDFLDEGTTTVVGVGGVYHDGYHGFQGKLDQGTSKGTHAPPIGNLPPPPLRGPSPLGGPLPLGDPPPPGGSPPPPKGLLPPLVGPPLP